jgi:hypothetical protein
LGVIYTVKLFKFLGWGHLTQRVYPYGMQELNNVKGVLSIAYSSENENDIGPQLFSSEIFCELPHFLKSSHS